MATIQYAPYIEGTIPAFVYYSLKIPYQDNPGVGNDEWNAMVCRISDITTNEVKGYFVADPDEDPTNKKDDIDRVNRIATFFIGSGLLTLGNYYKIQLAYLPTNFTGSNYSTLTFSTVGIARYLGNTTIFEIACLVEEYKLKGSFKNKTDSGIYEGEYSYSFQLYDANNNLILDSGEQLHKKDEIEDSYPINLNLSGDYKLKYNVTTINGYQVTAENTTITFPSLGTAENEDISFLSLEEKKVDQDNGQITVTIKNHENTSLIRKSSKDNYLSWERLCNVSSSPFVYCDKALEHGIQYQYGYLSNTLYYNETKIQAIFEDIFLSDAERSLCIKYNPKVSNFKDIILEQKIDTIGSKYPYFFRNGDVQYKEIPISGLISFNMDKNEQFMSKSQLGFDENSVIDNNLTNENIYAERIFKTEVLNWLNNGKPKLFKSPTEGTFVIRLMNVSLSPNEQLGRMLHTFSATGYEVMDLNFDKMRTAGVIS